MVMGNRGGTSALSVFRVFAVILSLFLSVSLQCKILKCNSEFWASFAHSGPEEEFCRVLQAFNICVHRTARTCRGDLAYHTAHHGIMDLMGQHNCSKFRPTSQPPFGIPLPPKPSLLMPNSQERSDPVPKVCHFESNMLPPSYTHCGFFGDPHLRTFGNNFQTCKVEGAWPLIHNKYLFVQVTNTPVLPGSLATATSKLTIIFNNFQECVDQKMYSAEVGMLPAAFADGSTNGGDKQGANSLRVVEKVPGQHVEIQAKYIGTTIVVRHVAQYLTFAVRMPEKVVTTIEKGDNQDLYLCLHGCPANQRIDLESFRAQVEKSHGLSRARSGTGIQGFTYQSAKAKCKEWLPVEDLYFQSCVFDLLSSGDINFTMAAYYAFEDVKMLHSNSHQFHIFEKETFLDNRAKRATNLFSLFLKNILAVFLCTKCCTLHHL